MPRTPVEDTSAAQVYVEFVGLYEGGSPQANGSRFGVAKVPRLLAHLADTEHVPVLAALPNEFLKRCLCVCPRREATDLDPPVSIRMPSLE